jgi:hypothetical protein
LVARKKLLKVWPMLPAVLAERMVKG